MSTLLARILRFGWLGSVALVLVAIMAIGIAVTITLVHPSAGGATSAPATSGANRVVEVSVTGTRILPIDPSHLPAPNHEFVAITIELSDTGSTAAAYGLDDFLLRDETGNVFDPDPDGAYLIGASALPLQGSLQPGQRRVGALVFEVLMSDHEATLAWQPAAGPTGGATTWSLAL